MISSSIMQKEILTSLCKISVDTLYKILEPGEKASPFRKVVPHSLFRISGAKMGSINHIAKKNVFP
jgi:hypothetical protein